MAKKPAASTSMTKYDERLAALAKSAKKAESDLGGAGNFLSFKAGVLSYRNAPVPGNQMRIIAVHAVIENALREDDYNPENPQPPSCYAFGTDFKTMGPDPAQVDNPVNPTCHDCELAQFGSADKGKGMACGVQRRRLALITEGDMEDIENAEMAFASLSYFSSKNWKGYVDQLEAVYHRPPLAFITELTVVPDAKSQFQVKFRMLEEIKDGALLEALLNRQEAVAQTINFPYPKKEEETKGARKANGKASKKVAKPVSRVPASVAVPSGPPPKLGLRKPVKAPKF